MPCQCGSRAAMLTSKESTRRPIAMVPLARGSCLAGLEACEPQAASRGFRGVAGSQQLCPGAPVLQAAQAGFPPALLSRRVLQAGGGLGWPWLGGVWVSGGGCVEGRCPPGAGCGAVVVW